ncbi:MAG: phosphoheptose isomerase [Crocinitomicaceae bacterium]|nr:phosphoheptose isomerase [Crocinitomicaceae bacterium]|tara:strand:+ start:1002 stop:1589 length:588 start_codon:yes stop_codon:yes gene_type:complete
MTIEFVKSEISKSIEVKNQVLNDEKLIGQVAQLAYKCVDVLQKGGKIIFCGNGGSFADAQHLSAEFTSRFLFDRPGLSSIALGTNSSSMTAIGNDYGYENVFSREIESIGNSVDILFAITTSGNSSNVLKVIDAAKRKKIDTIVMTGSERGKLGNDVETLNIPSIDIPRIQECHILIGHIICGLVESIMFDPKQS